MIYKYYYIIMSLTHYPLYTCTRYLNHNITGKTTHKNVCVLYLAGLSFLVVQHVEQEPKLTGKTELALTQVTQQDAAQRLNVVQHL